MIASPGAPRRVFITGATGVVGAHAIPAAVRELQMNG